MRRTLFLVAAVIFVGSGANAAQATTLSIRLCNHYRQVADFALAYRKDGLWTSMGWWRVPTGRCSTVPAVVPANSVYLSYVFPATQTGLTNTTHRFAVNSNIDHSFRIQKADQPRPGMAMFSFIPHRRTSEAQRFTSRSRCSATARPSNGNHTRLNLPRRTLFYGFAN